MFRIYLNLKYRYADKIVYYSLILLFDTDILFNIKHPKCKNLHPRQRKLPVVRNKHERYFLNSYSCRFHCHIVINTRNCLSNLHTKNVQIYVPHFQFTNLVVFAIKINVLIKLKNNSSIIYVPLLVFSDTYFNFKADYKYLKFLLSIYILYLVV